jgi:hypothetical protein
MKYALLELSLIKVAIRKDVHSTTALLARLILAGIRLPCDL